MSPGGFEPAIPASDRPQTLALDRSATSGTAVASVYGKKDLMQRKLFDKFKIFK
jgi:hypothetical protein